MENIEKLTDEELDQVSGGGGNIYVASGEMIVYMCECGYVFARDNGPGACPGCGRSDRIVKM